MPVKIQKSPYSTNITVYSSRTNTSSPNFIDIIDPLYSIDTKQIVNLYLKKLNFFTFDEARNLGQNLAEFFNNKKIVIETLNIDLRDDFQYQTEDGVIEYYYNKNALIVSAILLEKLEVSPEINLDTGSCTFINFIDTLLLAPHAKKITHLAINFNCVAGDITYYTNIDKLSQLITRCTNLQEFIISGRLCDRMKFTPDIADPNGELKDGIPSQVSECLLSALDRIQPKYVKIPFLQITSIIHLLRCPNTLFLKTYNPVFSANSTIATQELSALMQALGEAKDLKRFVELDEKSHPSLTSSQIQILNQVRRQRLSSNIKASEFIAPAVYDNNLDVLEYISIAGFFRLFSAHQRLIKHEISDSFIISTKQSSEIVERFKIANMSEYHLFFFITGVAHSVELQLNPMILEESTSQFALLSLPKEILNHIISFLTPLDIDSLIR